MFKGAYTDNFYRAVRDALHAEVDSWKPAADSLEPERFDREQVWTQVDLLEPLSRNPDATELPELETASLVPVRGRAPLSFRFDSSRPPLERLKWPISF